VLYRARNRIERFFNRIKHFRRLATRYEKHAANFLAMLKLAAIAYHQSPGICLRKRSFPSALQRRRSARARPLSIGARPYDALHADFLRVRD
jgi:hypothetical protein